MKISEFSFDHQRILSMLGIKGDKSIILLNGYPALYCKDRKLRYVHRLVAKHFLAERLTSRTVVHHRDGDRMNFLPRNLMVISRGEHNGEHRRFGAANHFFGKRHTPETRARLRRAALEREHHPVMTEEGRRRVRLFASKRKRDAEGRFI